MTQKNVIANEVKQSRTHAVLAAQGSPGRGRARGFSLLEVIVAFAVLSLAMGAGMALLSQSLRNVRVAHDHVHAAALAESLLAEAGVGEMRPRVEGGVSGGFEWRLTVTEQPAESDHPMRAHAVTVDVHGADGRTLTLHSLRVTGRGR
jgi:general secretion pathway protein I